MTFLSGVDQNGVLAPIVFETWDGNNPAHFGPLSTATKWGDPVAGTPATISYAFLAVSNWTAVERTAFTTAMALWSAVANVTFIEAGDEQSADFRIYRGSDGGAFWTFGDRTGVPTGGTTLMTPVQDGDGIPFLSIDTSVPGFGPIDLDLDAGGAYAFGTVVHELGHGLGLGHGGPYNGEVNAETQQFGPYDMKLWTIMSYIDPNETLAAYLASYPVAGTAWGKTADGDWRTAQTPMMLDILATQRLYGTATSGPLAEGGVVFGFNSNLEGSLKSLFDFSLNAHPVITIWSGGTGNALDLSGYTENAVINLQPGTFSSAAGLTNNIGIAFDTVIETAIGGSGADTIFGTELDNTLIGNAGRDIIYGGGGNDLISGGAGADFIVFGSSGSSILRETFADLNGDIITGVNTVNTIEIIGLEVSRADLTVSATADTVTFAAGSWSFRTDGAFSGGDFMLTPRDFGGDAQTVINFVNFLPVLSEGVTVDPTLINGIANAPFMTGDGAVSFRMEMVSADSHFQNMLGYYKIETTGTISDVHLLTSNTMDQSTWGAGFDLGAPDSGEQIGFFLIQDGFAAYGGLPSDLSFVLSGDSGAPPSLYSSSLGFLTKAEIFYSTAAFNPDDADQVLSGVIPGGGGLQIGFEDVANGFGDNDYQDVVIALKSLSSDGLFL
ncbi:M10 family metallopeptidase C-terminal domain-containing protein [Aquabacter sp. CN5-332]|uniref:M10 family metallopeptidase C-terminal domain-containing protein n=1 Tax=Aquabacter sp. CN5-332 TaxID=3156608 RepID=UPI0032B525CF